MSRRVHALFGSGSRPSSDHSPARRSSAASASPGASAPIGFFAGFQGSTGSGSTDIFGRVPSYVEDDEEENYEEDGNEDRDEDQDDEEEEEEEEEDENYSPPVLTPRLRTRKGPLIPEAPKYPPKPIMRSKRALRVVSDAAVKDATPLPSNLILSSRGDMNMDLSHSGTSIKVTVESRILQLASPVFCAMLGSQFKEGAELSRASEQHYMELYDLELPEDDAGAMITAMRVLHHNNHQVPHKVSEAELVELAVISEKYELYEAMYPRTLQWIPPHIEEALESESGIDGYLFVAWAFREKPLFEKLSRFLIIESTLAQDGSLIPRHGMQLLQSIPESILNEMLKRRKNAVDRLLSICWMFVERYAHWDQPICSRSPFSGHACSTMMLGAVMKCLCSVKLRPGADDPTARLRSVQDIVNSLHGLQTKIYKFVRDRVCSPQVNRGGGSGGRVTVGAGCDTHGDLKLCPGKSFHVECSFLPQMLREVNLVFEDVKGLELDDFASRKVPG